MLCKPFVGHLNGIPLERQPGNAGRIFTSSAIDSPFKERTGNQFCAAFCVAMHSSTNAVCP